MTAILLGSTTLVPPSESANPSRPAVHVLHDGTALIAWVDLSTGTLHVQQWSRDLTTQIDALTAPAASGGTRGVVIAIAAATVVLAVGDDTTGAVHTVTTGPLALGPAAPYETAGPWASWRRVIAAPANAGGRAVVAAGRQVFTIASDGALERVHEAYSTVMGMHHVGGVIYLSMLDSGDATTVWSLDPVTWAAAPLTTGPPVDVTYSAMSAASPGSWVFPAMEWGRDHFVTLDQSGAVVNESEWPPTPRWMAGYAGMAPTDDGGTILAIPHREARSGWPTSGRVSIVTVDAAGSIESGEVMDDLSRFDTLQAAEGPVVATYGTTVIVASTHLGGPSDDSYSLTAWTVALAATPAPDPDVPPPFGIPEVLIDGVPADIESIRVRADSPADFRIPPGGSTLALSQATLGWEHCEDAQVDAEQPWHGAWRPTPGASVEVRLPKPYGAYGFVAFTGVLDTTDGALAPSTLTSRAISPLADVDATFTAPALNRVMPCPPGGGTPESRRFVHSGTSWYVVEAFEAIGARYTVPVGGFTVWRQTMAGSTWPTIGDLLVSQELNDAGTGPDTPTPEDQNSTYAPQFGPAYGEPGRVTMSDGWCHGSTAPYGGAASDAWTIAHDVDEDPAADYRVRLHSAVSQAGFEVRVAGSTITVRTVDGAGAVDATLGSIPRAGVSRVMVRYDSGTVTAAADSDPGTVHSWPATIAALAATQAHVTIYGSRVGAVTIDRAGDPLAGHEHLVWPRQGLVHISPVMDERWRFHSHPAIASEVATTWLARRAHAEQALLHVDQVNRVHWVEVRGFDDLPVVGELTDATLYGTTPTP